MQQLNKVFWNDKIYAEIKATIYKAIVQVYKIWELKKRTETI